MVQVIFAQNLRGTPSDRATVATAGAEANLMLTEWKLPEGVFAGAVSLLRLARGSENLPEFDNALVRTWRSLLAEKFVRAVLVGLAITIVGFFLNYDNFVGTPKELAAIFFWAFGLDISVEVLMQKGPTLQRS